jgi:hypothetical protein
MHAQQKKGRSSTCAGVLGADAVEVKLQEQGEGQEEVGVMDEGS